MSKCKCKTLVAAFLARGNRRPTPFRDPQFQQLFSLAFEKMTKKFFLGQDDDNGQTIDVCSFAVINDHVLVERPNIRDSFLDLSSARAQWSALLEVGWREIEEEEYLQSFVVQEKRGTLRLPSRVALGQKNTETEDIVSLCDFIPIAPDQVRVVDIAGDARDYSLKEARLLWRKLTAEGWVEIPFRVSIALRARDNWNQPATTQGPTISMRSFGDTRTVSSSKHLTRTHLPNPDQADEYLKPFRHLEDNWDPDAIK